MFSAATTRALDTWKFFKGSVNFFSSNSEEGQNFRDEVDIKEEKSFCWNKRACAMRPKEPDFGYVGAEFSRVDARILKSLSTRVENAYACGRAKTQ